MVERALSILQRLGKEAAVPYHETKVSLQIKQILEEQNIEYFEDKYGNIIASYRNPARENSKPQIAFVSHMDHPGIEIISIGKSDLVGKMIGRTSDSIFTKPTPLIIHDSIGQTIKGKSLGRHSNSAETLQIMTIEDVIPILPAFAVFDLPEFILEDGKIRMRACDDLVGCAASLTILEHLAKENKPGNVQAIFTRAEEAGLVGARLIAHDELISKETIIISIETSKSIPGGEIGKGPIIRVGDAATTFSQQAESLLNLSKEHLKKREKDIQIQRQLMDGGVCEASAFILNGYSATGIAFPLAHYHNGLGESLIEPEFIDANDFMVGLDLLLETTSINIGDESDLFARLKSHPSELSEKLKRK
jgi:endoglucanase